MRNMMKSLLKGCLVGLPVALLVFFGGIEGRAVRGSIANLEKEESVQAQRDQIDDRSPAEIVSPTNKKPDKFTQTEAHLSLKSMRDLIEKTYPDTEKHLNVVSTVIANEAEHKDTHYAFYNTTSNSWRLAQDLYTRLYAYENPDKVTEEFKFLRFNDESVNETAQGFLVNELKTKGLVDDNTDTKFIMLSVNLSLFGNVGFPGECSWQYFLKPQAHAKPVRAVYVQMMKRFGLTDKYIDQLMDLLNIYDTPEDTIIQVLVPIEKVDEIGYLAWVKGIPAHGDTIKWIRDNVKKRKQDLNPGFAVLDPKMKELTATFAEDKEKNPLFADMLKNVESGKFSLEAFLKLYRNTPWKIKELNDVTARLLFTPNVLLNPNSGVKFFRFSTVTKDKLKEYNSKLNGIIKKMIAEKEAKGATAQTVPQK